MEGFRSQSRYHLLALIEDADARLQADIEPSSHGNSLTASACANAGFVGSECQSSTCSEVLEGFKELSQITLLVDCNTELFDVTEAYLRFARVSDQAQIRLGMPTLRPGCC